MKIHIYIGPLIVCIFILLGGYGDLPQPWTPYYNSLRITISLKMHFICHLSHNQLIAKKVDKLFRLVG